MKVSMQCSTLDLGTTKELPTVDLPDAVVVILIDVSLDGDIGSILIAEDNLDPTLIRAMLDKL